MNDGRPSRPAVGLAVAVVGQLPGVAGPPAGRSVVPDRSELDRKLGHEIRAWTEVKVGRGMLDGQMLGRGMRNLV